MSNTLTKADITDAIQKENGYSRKQSAEVTEILLEIIKQSLESGADVMIARRLQVIFVIKIPTGFIILIGPYSKWA